MSKKKEKPIVLSEITPEEKLKYEIAEELGLLDKVLKEGWRSLSSKETGRIGGLITKKRRNQENLKSLILSPAPGVLKFFSCVSRPGRGFLMFKSCLLYTSM